MHEHFVWHRGQRFCHYGSALHDAEEARCFPIYGGMRAGGEEIWELCEGRGSERQLREHDVPYGMRQGHWRQPWPRSHGFAWAQTSKTRPVQGIEAACGARAHAPKTCGPCSMRGNRQCCVLASWLWVPPGPLWDLATLPCRRSERHSRHTPLAGVPECCLQTLADLTCHEAKVSSSRDAANVCAVLSFFWSNLSGCLLGKSQDARSMACRRKMGPIQLAAGSAWGALASH